MTLTRRESPKAASASSAGLDRPFRRANTNTVWVVSSYQLAVLVALLPCGVIGEMVGARRVFLTGVALFTLASAACAFSSTLPMLVVARFVQGLGGGAIMALGIMNLRLSVPQRLLGTIIGVNAMTIAVASAAGPGIAGAILAVASWPWLFAVNIPLGIVVLAARSRQDRGRGAPGRRRWITPNCHVSELTTRHPA